MGPEDEVIVTKNTDGNINLKDTKTSKEYMIVQESEMDGEFDETEEFYESDLNPEDIFEFEDDEEDDYQGNLDKAFEDVFSEQYDEEEGEMDKDDSLMYELELGDDGDLDETDGDQLSMDYMDEDMDLYESKSFKPKGKGFGTPNKFKYSSKPNQEGGFNTKKKEGPKSVGTGKAKFTYKDGENLDGEFKINPKKKVEANEASRTLGAGKRFGKNSLDKPKAAPRHLRKESVDGELNLLREKNNEYRNALNVFRDKLNEVAVFNSNLAYATRLFTEHTTTKHEKINILQRFDSVETIKESKNLYQTIKQELNKDNSSKPINESIERSIDNSPSTGSAINLIESKTYENPQFLRMRDLMSKLK
jgi:hypothetical protein